MFGRDNVVGSSHFQDCLIAIDFKGNAYLIDAPLLESDENGYRNDLFSLLDETGESSFLFETENKTQGIYLADIDYLFIEHYYPMGEKEYGFDIEMKNLRFITIER